MKNIFSRRALLIIAVMSASTGISTAAESPNEPAKPASLDVRSFGTTGDGTNLETAAIQKAIDSCQQQGGGTVNFPPGRYVSGTILLKDNVTLHLDTNAVLLGSLNIEDYRAPDQFRSGNGAEMGYCFVGAVEAAHVGITGAGMIDGRGKELLAARGKADKAKRPFLVRFVRCTDVAVEDIHLGGPAAWTMHFSQCRRARAERVHIDSHGVGNNDGIDVDSSQGVLIKDCEIDSGDDAICLKTTSAVPCRDIEVTGCKLKSRWAAFKIGTESFADFDNIRVLNCRFSDTRGGGIKLLSVDGAKLQNVVVSDITMDNVTMPVFIRLGARSKTFREGDQPRPAGALNNVLIRDVRGTSPSSPCVVISGIPGHAVEGVTLENIDLRLAGGGPREDARVTLQEKESAYPEITMFGKRLPAYGVFARHVNGLRISGLVIHLDAADLRPALVCQDVANLECSKWTVPAQAGAESLLRLESCRQAQIKEFHPEGRMAVFLRAEGEGSRGIALQNNALAGAGKAFELGSDAPAGTVTSR